VTQQEALAVYQFGGFLAKGWGAFLNQSFPGIPANTNISSLGLLVGFQIATNPDGLMRTVTINHMGGVGISLLELWMNPKYSAEIDKNYKVNDDYYKDLFKRLDLSAAFNAYFSSLWYSTLPCYDIQGVSAQKDGDSAILKKCLWKGLPISCSAIFEKFPTDRGMCCTFNRAAAEDVFKESTYTRLMNDLKKSDKSAAFQNSTLPDWYVNNNEPTSRTGVNLGLTVYLDAHTDLVESLSINSDIAGFNALIAPTSDFPLTFQKGFEVKAGHKNLIALSATKIDADDGIRSIEPVRRNCRFPDEAEELKLHKNYSQANCFLECALFYAQDKQKELNNGSHVCTPWFFPFSDEGHVMCDPWEATQLVHIMEHDIPTDQCSNCLPDCSRTIYQYTTSGGLA
jgi:hypothetical protein